MSRHAIAWAKNNKEKIARTQRKYYSRNKEKRRKYSEEWKKKNPAKTTAQEGRHRALRLKRVPPWLTKEQKKQIQSFYILAREMNKTGNPDDPFQVDHIVPLRGKEVSGLHVPWNLQILLKSENDKKSNKVSS